jgi:uncharacterized protein YgiM (DUF1202 family)
MSGSVVDSEVEQRMRVPADMSGPTSNRAGQSVGDCSVAAAQVARCRTSSLSHRSSSWELQYGSLATLVLLVVMVAAAMLFSGRARHATTLPAIADRVAVVGATGAYIGEAMPPSGKTGRGPRQGTLAFGAASRTPARVGVTTEDNVNLRRGPGRSHPVIARLPRGTQLEVLDQQQGWYRVATARGSVGWIAGDYFSLDPNHPARSAPGAAGEVPAITIDEGVHLRAGPGRNFASRGKLAIETELDVLSRQGGWYRVRTPRGTVGWVASEFVALDIAASHLLGVEGSAVGAEGAAGSLDVVRVAQQFLGAPYLWGGATPRGFDCSGFTQYVYRQVGVRLPRTANQQYSSRVGKRIKSMSALAPGDLVYFERTTEESGITHAGIYVGGGRIIAARSERLGVRYVSLYEPFWNTRFVGGIRPYR